MPYDDHESFTRLWMPIQPAVASFVSSILLDQSAVDDVVQEVAIVAWRRFADYDRERPFIAWAIGIARLTARSWRRDRAIRLRVTAEAAEQALAEAAERTSQPVSDAEAALHDCLKQVNGRNWRILRMHYHDGLPAAEIGAALGLDGGHVRVLLNRVRALLRDCIERRVPGMP